MTDYMGIYGWVTIWLVTSLMYMVEFHDYMTNFMSIRWRYYYIKVWLVVD